MRVRILETICWIFSIEAFCLCLCLPLCSRIAPLNFLPVIPRSYWGTSHKGSTRKPITATIEDTGTDDLSAAGKHEYDGLLELRRNLRERHGKEHPLRENFIKGTGPGGQKVNKSNNCVQLIQYSPTLGTNIVVKCHVHRSLLRNRIEATRILIRRLNEAEEEPAKFAKHLEEKEKRKILKLSKAEKAKKLFEKQLRSEKKANRRNTRVIDQW